MWTLELRGGARVAVVAGQWYDAFGVVTRGRVQLELRDGEPGPVLGRDAGFWLRGTGVRALRNPGLRTATVRIVTPGARTATGRRSLRRAGRGDGGDAENAGAAAVGPSRRRRPWLCRRPSLCRGPRGLRGPRSGADWRRPGSA
ncbi:hypothetical protein K4B79_08645 [Streptomyces lincolnensis]|uniref:hypothetical protein n=1 Tax=Streptomyces lincolnensis TaxID=1915 RepID=UPI001E2ED6ED|nr:hypothetical protein [Streptomyces lincolnensis]MCD7438299.1 hypothetical protein [Streptomyces lincolnensis]